MSQRAAVAAGTWATPGREAFDEPLQLALTLTHRAGQPARSAGRRIHDVFIEHLDEFAQQALDTHMTDW